MMTALGAAAGLLAGGGISLLNARLTRRAAARQSGTAGLMALSLARQTLNAGLLLAIYFLRNTLPFPLFPVLAGAAAGLTVPSLAAALRLAGKKRVPGTAPGGEN